MKKSAFQFSNPILNKLEFCLNEGFVPKEDDSIEIGMNMAVEVSRSSSLEEANVSLHFTLGEKEGKSPFYIIAVESANFKWEKELEEQRVEQLLTQNAPSLLLSYLRPIVAQITSASPFDAYNIPFINFKPADVGESKK